MQSFILDRHTDPNNPTMKVTQDDKIPVYDSLADAQADIANLEEGQIGMTGDSGATEKVVDVVQDGNMNPVTSNAVYDVISDSRVKRKSINVTFSDTTVTVPLSQIGAGAERIISAHYRGGASGASAFLTGIDLTRAVALVQVSPVNNVTYSIDFFYF